MTDEIKIDEKKADKLRKKQVQPHKTIFEIKRDGTLKTNSVKNVVLILKTDKNLQNLFRYNEFTAEIDVVRDADIQTDFGLIEISKGKFTDQVSNSVELYIESSNKYLGAAFKNQIIDQGISNVAYMDKYNPVKDYMNKAYTLWDKKKRLDKFFHIYLGAEENESLILITRLFFMGVVAKIYNPKVKFDFVLDLVGGQGAGKTTLLQSIAPLGLYTDQFNSFTNKDDFEVMKNAVIVNDDEMTASNAASFEEIKKFITMQQFEYRRSYARKSERFAKKFVMTRTTNEKRHLKDRSGDRRFISIFVNKAKQEKSPVTDLTDEYIQQLWGEAVHLYKNTKDPFLLTKGQEELLKENRNQFRYTSGLEDTLMDVLENKFKGAEFIPNTKLAFEIFADRDALSRNNKETRDIRYYMSHLGYDTGARRWENGKAVRGFKKE
ncbi:putative P-loop ATPase [Lactobacillus colini]|uniref:P-loop ATPase n=1 Tax=Lactobacillus colini TaxID=1819254 RepID=A0ABS4MCC1_9LACO|nr:putative P-loop ATPase [Lactobacillus colini]